MPIEIVVPRLGWSMDQGTFGEWLKRDGERVHAGDMLFVLEGEKASQEIESFDAGMLHIPPDAPKPGDTVAVGQLLGYLLAEGEAAPARRATAVIANAAVRQADRQTQPRVAGPAARRRARELGIDLNALQTPDPTGRIRTEDLLTAKSPMSAATRTRTDDARHAVTPRARRKARELGVNSAKVHGSGRNGRVRERDVIAFGRHASYAAEGEALPVAEGTWQPASKIRRTIAQRMLAGVQQTAPVTLTTKVDAAPLIAYREQLKAEGGEIVPSYTDILAKLVAIALPECPALNACWHNDGVFTYDEINVAIAVDTDSGLVAPVIKNVMSLSLQEIAAQSRLLAERARAGALSQNHLQGSTFTITNLGMFDIDFFTPIINLPQAAILGVGRIVREPVVEGDVVVPGWRLGLSLTFDHRIVDGAPAARWLQHLGQMLQDLTTVVA
ncbi:MAG: 2-oxo acid dehydrogenase subunit E2 [Planctomycetaceae bacterium]|nr:2-oxo acid dehydrogenase subunit E2 [Planctomycetaceae bacterium]